MNVQHPESEDVHGALEDDVSRLELRREPVVVGWALVSSTSENAIAFGRGLSDSVMTRADPERVGGWSRRLRAS
jgi:hypothetical protein